MLNLKKTDSKIIQKNNEKPDNNSSLQNFTPKEKARSDRAHEIEQFQVSKNSHPTELQDRIIEAKTCKDYEKHSETYTELQKPSKLPQTLKNTLRRRAKESGHFREKKEVQKMSPITLSIFSKFKKQEFACEICLGVMNSEDIVHLCKCNHVYCKNCTRDYVTYKIQMFEEVICPNEQCNKVMSQQTEFYQNLAEQIKKKYVKIHNFYMTSNDPSLKLCPKADCEGIIKLKENQPVFCEACKRQFCPKCYLDSHEGACDQQEIDFLQNNLHFRQCDNCKFIVERTQGCNHMTCRCKYQFCYICGKKWTGFQHACNQNSVDQQNDGLFEQNGCCGCINCCEQVCGQTLAFIFQFPIRLIFSILFIAFLVVVASQTLMMIVFYLFAAIVAGIFGYSIEFLCELCDKGRYGLALLLTILFPLAICVGLYKAFIEMFIDLVADQFNDLWGLTYDQTLQSKYYFFNNLTQRNLIDKKDSIFLLYYLLEYRIISSRVKRKKTQNQVFLPDQQAQIIIGTDKLYL